MMARIKVPGHLIRGAGGRVKVPRRYYTLEVSRGYRQVTRGRAVCLQADQFLDGKQAQWNGAVRRRASFDIEWGEAPRRCFIEDGVPVLDGRCGVETGVDEVSVVALKGLCGSPENTARIHGRDTRIGPLGSSGSRCCC